MTTNNNIIMLQIGFSLVHFNSLQGFKQKQGEGGRGGGGGGGRGVLVLSLPDRNDLEMMKGSPFSWQLHLVRTYLADVLIRWSSPPQTKVWGTSIYSYIEASWCASLQIDLNDRFANGVNLDEQQTETKVVFNKIVQVRILKWIWRFLWSFIETYQYCNRHRACLTTIIISVVPRPHPLGGKRCLVNNTRMMLFMDLSLLVMIVVFWLVRTGVWTIQ